MPQSLCKLASKRTQLLCSPHSPKPFLSCVCVFWLTNANLFVVQAQRDLLAAIDYEIVCASELFIGNSVSTFSALQLLRREAVRLKESSSSDPSTPNSAASASATFPSATDAAAAAVGNTGGGSRLRRAKGRGDASVQLRGVDGFHYNGEYIYILYIGIYIYIYM